MLWLNEEAGWTLFQFSAVDLSVWVGGLVCSASPQAEKGETAQPFPPDKKGRNTASKPRRVRDSSEPPILSRPNPHTRGRQGGEARALSQVQLSRLSGPQRCPSSIHLFSNARRLAQSEPGAHQSLVACAESQAAACTRTLQGKAKPFPKSVVASGLAASKP